MSCALEQPDPALTTRLHALHEAIPTIGARLRGEVWHPGPPPALTVRVGDPLTSDLLEPFDLGNEPPLRVVTSPDNSFLPLGATAHQTGALRGVAAVLVRDGRTIEIATGGVIVSIYALRPALARSAAMTAVPINAPGAPGAPLPPP